MIQKTRMERLKKAEKGSFEKYQNVNKISFPNTKTTASKACENLSLESLCQPIEEQNSYQSSSLCIPNSQGIIFESTPQTSTNIHGQHSEIEQGLQKAIVKLSLQVIFSEQRKPISIMHFEMKI
ncbi:hypothetical protein CDAR_480121 [Caerostris darwini]|uniref:Uncharacterized protein n=1 Tax=Caerostris darwini TaxID=1538125 RepID=A0AAV4T149_9ARAC|nr:hypothetical protein CDAR_480121 [Caerostris darwini]